MSSESNRRVPCSSTASVKKTEHPLGIEYIKADLALLPDLGQPFDAVVASMVFCSIPDWRTELANCVRVLPPGGLLIFSVNHPSFEPLRETRKDEGCLEVSKYLHEYAIEGGHGTDWHRPLSVYLKETVGCGCRLREIAEPGLDAAIASGARLASRRTFTCPTTCWWRRNGTERHSRCVLGFPSLREAGPNQDSPSLQAKHQDVERYCPRSG